jgi:hypothetical protein
MAEDALFAAVCDERDAAARRVLLLEQAVTYMTEGRLRVRLSAEGWYAVTPDGVGETFGSAVEAVVSALS